MNWRRPVSLYGQSILNAGFLQFDNEFTEKLRATWGVRVEDYDQVIGSTKSSDPRYCT